MIGSAGKNHNLFAILPCILYRSLSFCINFCHPFVISGVPGAYRAAHILLSAEILPEIFLYQHIKLDCKLFRVVDIEIRVKKFGFFHAVGI